MNFWVTYVCIQIFIYKTSFLGKLIIESEVGKGSTFGFTIPFPLATPMEESVAGLLRETNRTSRKASDDLINKAISSSSELREINKVAHSLGRRSSFSIQRYCF
jgi:hypothetical protein